MRSRLISSFRMLYSECSAKQCSELIKLSTLSHSSCERLLNLALSNMALRRTTKCPSNLVFTTSFIDPFLFVCQSEACNYIICLVPHCIHQCIYLRNFLVFVQRRCKPEPFKYANPFRPFVGSFERERFWPGDLECLGQVDCFTHIWLLHMFTVYFTVPSSETKVFY